MFSTDIHEAGKIKTALTGSSIPSSEERHQSETMFAVVKAAEEWQRVKTMCQESSAMRIFVGDPVLKSRDMRDV